MSTRLTQEMRRHIAMEARKISPINKQIDTIHTEKCKLGEVIRRHALGGLANVKKYDNIAKQMESLREELPDNLVSFSLGINKASRIAIQVGEYSNSLPLEGSQVVPTQAFCIDDIPAVLESYKELVDRSTRLKKEVKQVEYTVYQSISGINTLKQLLEAWPEVVELLPENLKQPKVRLPALRADNLNKLIGLPTDKKTNGAKP